MAFHTFHNANGIIRWRRGIGPQKTGLAGEGVVVVENFYGTQIQETWKNNKVVALDNSRAIFEVVPNSLVLAWKINCDRYGDDYKSLMSTITILTFFSILVVWLCEYFFSVTHCGILIVLHNYLIWALKKRRTERFFILFFSFFYSLVFLKTKPPLVFVHIIQYLVYKNTLIVLVNVIFWRSCNCSIRIQCSARGKKSSKKKLSSQLQNREIPSIAYASYIIMVYFMRKEGL